MEWYYRSNSFCFKSPGSGNYSMYKIPPESHHSLMKFQISDSLFGICEELEMWGSSMHTCLHAHVHTHTHRDTASNFAEIETISSMMIPLLEISPRILGTHKSTILLPKVKICDLKWSHFPLSPTIFVSQARQMSITTAEKP